MRTVYSWAAYTQATKIRYIYLKDSLPNKMHTGTKKLELIEWLIRLNDNTLIDYLKSIKDSKSSSKDWWDELSQQELESIDRGIKDIEEGRTHTHESVMKKYDKYL